MMRFCYATGVRLDLPRQLLQELLLVEPVLEGLAAVNEDDWHFVGELTTQKFIGFHVNFAPAETAPALELRQLLFDDLAQVTSLAGINDNFAKEGHRGESSKIVAPNPHDLRFFDTCKMRSGATCEKDTIRYLCRVPKKSPWQVRLR